MSDSVRDLLVRGIAAARSHYHDEARFYLEWVLRTSDADEEQRSEALIWLVEVTDAPAQKRHYLEEILAADPYNARARRVLALLDGRLKQEEVVDPDRLGQSAVEVPDRCPECGGAMIFTADGKGRQCERCGWRPGPTVTPETLLAQGIAAAKAGRRGEARSLLEQVTRANAPAPLKIQAWLWLTETHDDVDQKRRCLEAVLALDASNAAARKGLQLLSRRLEAPAPAMAEPQLQPTAPAQPAAVTARRFVCPQCGGRMAFAAGTSALRCDYCGHQESLVEALRSGVEVTEQDFLVTMATAKGHTRPTGMRSFKCQGCGANFLVPQETLSLTCAYCGSAHAVELPTRELIPPEGIIPFVLTQDEAQTAFREWLKKRKLREEAQTTALQGLYLPVWTFDIGGEVRWQCEVTQRRSGLAGAIGAAAVSPTAGLMELGGALSNQSVRKGEVPVFYNDLLVTASHTLPADLVAELDNFEGAIIVPYEERYLANWPAEVYQVTVSDASIVARQKAVALARRSIGIQIEVSVSGEVQNLHWSSAGMVVESYKLILVPLWLARYRFRDALYTVVINGQRGSVRGQEPPGLVKKLLGGLLG